MSDWDHRKARKVMSKFLERDLNMHEHVHHKDENPSNNHISNLQIMSAEQHAAHHRNAKGCKHKNPAHNKLSNVKIKNIISMRRQGYNYTKIANSKGISSNTVRNYCLLNKI